MRQLETPDCKVQDTIRQKKLALPADCRTCAIGCVCSGAINYGDPACDLARKAIGVILQTPVS